MAMELRQLKYFISAATHLNFTKAAKECFIVQTAMTAQMTNLEKELGVKLFERQNRGLSLTEAGVAFLEEAKEIVAKTQRAREKMTALQGNYRAVLRVGHHGEMFRADLLEILRAYRRRCPEVKVMLYQIPRGELVSGVREGQLDLALMPYEERFQRETKWLEWEILSEESCLLAVSADHPLAERKEIALSEISAYPRIGFMSGVWITIDEGKEDNRYGQVRDHTSLELLIESGYCVGIWAERMCRRGNYPNLRFLPITDFPHTMNSSLIWKRDSLSAEAEAFRQEVLRQYRER